MSQFQADLHYTTKLNNIDMRTSWTILAKTEIEMYQKINHSLNHWLDCLEIPITEEDKHSTSVITTHLHTLTIDSILNNKYTLMKEAELKFLTIRETLQKQNQNDDVHRHFGLRCFFENKQVYLFDNVN